MKYMLVRYQNANGTIPESPAPAYAIMEDGKLVFNLTAEQMDEFVNQFFGSASVKQVPEVAI